MLCPVEGAKCLDGQITLKEGFWYDPKHGSLAEFLYKKNVSLVSATLGVYRCPRRDRCNANEDTGRVLCKDNHQGPLCSVCDEGFYLAGYMGCERCPSGGRTALSIFLFVLALSLRQFFAIPFCTFLQVLFRQRLV